MPYNMAEGLNSCD